MMSKLISIRLSEDMISEAIEGLKYQKDLVSYVMTTPQKKREFDKLATRVKKISQTINIMQDKKNRICATNFTMIKGELHEERNPVSLKF